MKKKFNISNSISFSKYFITSSLLLFTILFSLGGYKILSFIFSVLFFYKAYKVYLMRKNKITEIEIGDEIVKLYNNNELVFESSKEKLLFMEFENGLIKMEFEKKLIFYLDFGINKSEIKILIGEPFFVMMKNGSFFSLSSVLDILDILR